MAQRVAVDVGDGITGKQGRHQLGFGVPAKGPAGGGVESERGWIVCSLVRKV